MITENELIKQNLNDMRTVIVVQSEILMDKELTEEENERLKYCIKLLQQVTEKLKKK